MKHDIEIGWRWDALVLFDPPNVRCPLGGRSIPSRQMLLDLAQALDVPLRERNELLMAAGYAPLYADQALNAPLMNSISKALQRMLHQHEPFPAIVMDRHWNVLMTNGAAPRLFNCFNQLCCHPRSWKARSRRPQGTNAHARSWK